MVAGAAPARFFRLTGGANRMAVSNDENVMPEKSLPLQIRAAELSDGAAIAELLDSLGYPDTGGFIESKLAQQLAHPDARLMVATDASKVLGFISLHFIPQIALAGDFCRISYFCVSGNARSEGLGARLEEVAVALAQER
jgi:N-acetylglutamate synthase-like GNAT family acetyltransferase